MKLTGLILPLLFIPAILPGNTSQQSDWSGGPEEPGPVTNWETVFHSSTNMEYSETPGQITLEFGKLTDSGREIPGSNLYGIGAYPGDVDLDGDLDILATSTVDNQALWWENTDGAGTSWISHQIAVNLSGAWGAQCIDIDKDGDNDVFGSAMGADVVLWWENTDGAGTSWTEHSIDDSFDGAKAIAAADINADGEIDVTAAAKTDDQIVWYRNGGSGSSWTKIIVADSLSGANSVYPTDMDQDGDLDILSVGKTENAVRWYENSDSQGTTWIEHSVGENFELARTAEAADIDGDGDTDVMASGGLSKASGRLHWFENTNGQGTAWTAHVIEEEFTGPYTILQYDLDEDGDPDAVSGSISEAVICWWENTGQGTGWEKHILCNYYAPRTVSVADIDGDGAVEVFGGSLYSLNITIWEVFGYQQEAVLHSCILDTQGDTDWTDLAWSGSTPVNTTLGISMRSSWDEANLGDWSDTVYTSPQDPSSLIDDTDRFVQYAVIMGSDDPTATPVLTDISLSWDPLGISEEESGSVISLTSVNPSRESLTLTCTIPENQSGTLSLFDLSGRIIFQSGEGIVSSTSNLISISDLQPGIYFAKLDHSEGTITGRFTVIR